MHSSAVSVRRSSGGATIVTTEAMIRHNETNTSFCFRGRFTGKWCHNGMPMPYFDIEERQEGDWTRLRLVGELDLAAASGLEDRLRQLSEANKRVRVDLSKLDFIDSSGIRLLIH